MNSRIKKTGESIQRKLQGVKPLDYKKILVDPNQLGKPDFTINKKDLVNEIQQDSLPVRQLTSKKKMTFYISTESETKFNEVFSRHLMRNQKVDKSALIAKAIELLWKEEKKHEL